MKGYNLKIVLGQNLKILPFLGILAVLGLGGCENPWMKEAVAPLYKNKEGGENNGGGSGGSNYHLTLYVAQTGSDITGDGTADNPYATMDKALGAIKTAYTDSAWPGRGTAAAGPARILVSGTINTGAPSPALFNIEDSALYAGCPPVTLAGKTADDNYNKLNAGTSPRALYTHNVDVTLAGGLTLTGGDASGVYVDAGGTFTMTGGAIRGNTGGLGGGVYVYTGGVFTMKGGTIGGSNTGEGNTAVSGGAAGGGVYVSAGGTFTMSGSTAAIKGNSAGSGGGVYVSGSGASFTMTGGTIGGSNPAEKNSAVIGGSGGGVYVSAGGTFIMSGSTAAIKGNSAGSGGGVYVSGSGASFTMNGGTIGGAASGEGNTTTTGSGGGVYVYNGGTFAMSGSTAAIKGNSAGSGGGVYFNSSGKTFTMNGGTIGGSTTGEKNTATSNGGGVYVAAGDFEMGAGAKISGN
ncbi:MAG: hypothetical protein LBK77_02760, partial [Spirochaetaceae bacterium]|nr:hypothetical protein [Spirochaetaceae bacterium]